MGHDALNFHLNKNRGGKMPGAHARSVPPRGAAAACAVAQQLICAYRDDRIDDFTSHEFAYAFEVREMTAHNDDRK